MKTTQVMERKFMDGTIRQNHKTAWFNATDLIKITNEYRKQIGESPKMIADYFRTDSTKEFIKEILDKEDISKVYEAKRGKNGGTWVHPLIFIDIAMWLSPKFKYKALGWLEDNLLKNRNLSGDSYKKMTSALCKRKDIPIAKIGTVIPQIAGWIKSVIKVDDWNKASVMELRQRDDMHNNITVMLKAGVEINKALKIALNEHNENVLEAKEGDSKNEKQE